MNASDARVRPKPPQPASAHGRIAHSGHAIHGRSTHHFTQGRPQNDVKVSTDDPGSEDAGQGTAPGGQDAAPQGNASQDTAHAPATRPGSAAHGKRSPRKHSGSQSRPSTGPDTAFSIPEDADMTGDMDGMDLPPEASDVLKAIGTRQQPAPVTAGQPVQAPGRAVNGQPMPGRATNGRPAQATPGRMINGRPVQAMPGRAVNGKVVVPARQGKAAGILPAAARIGDSSSGATRLTLRTSTGHTVTLRCDPPGGDHPKAEQACQDVAKSGGDLQQMPANANPRACFMIYAPVTVSAQGDYRGQPVKFQKKYPNTCVMRDKTGSIFDF